MTDDFVSQFITSIVNAGILPKITSDITPSDTFKRVQTQGDKAGKRSISYWLKVEYDFAYGYARDFKTGCEIRFNSATNNPNITRSDMARINAILKARKAEEEIRTATRQAKIADRAKIKWGKSATIGTTPYIEKKGVDLLSARIYGERNVMVPIYEPQKNGNLDLVSWQMIEADGTKRFPFGGKKKGCFHVIGQINPTKPILICEGWATGASLHMATGQAVAVAFDEGNLLPVSKAIRHIYTQTPIIIAADNDESLVGQKSAAKVQKSVTNVSVIMPKKAGQDFNDLQLEEVKTYFNIEAESGGEVSIGSDSQSHIPAADWQRHLILDGKNRVVATSLQNAIVHLIYHPELSGTFAFDEFKQAILVKKCPVWQEDAGFRVDRITDIQITQAAATLERYGLTCTIEKTAKAIQVAANESKFHSAKEYFSSLVWDGQCRLETFLAKYLQCKVEHPDYLSFVFTKWMTAAVKRIMEPGCKFDHVLILESQKQGLYKSSLLKTLATFNGETYHSDAVNISDIGNKDTALKLQGNMIVELAELTGFSKQDDEVIKNWITQQIDEVRIPFSRETSRFKRQFVFAATTNNHDYLKDPTGNRRYWPVTLEHQIDLAKIEAVKGQLWAEAYWLYKDGLYIGPTNEENELAEYERNKRLTADAWEDDVISIATKLGDNFKVNEILNRMTGLRTNEKNEKTVRRVSKILKMNGYDNSPKWDADQSKSVRLWSK